MECRAGCAACCIAPSISSAIPGMPQGKKAGERCVQLDENNLCLLFGLNERPQVCLGFTPEIDFCGETTAQALALINRWELITKVF